MQKNNLNLHICGIHLLNPYKTVVSHLKRIKEFLFVRYNFTLKKKELGIFERFIYFAVRVCLQSERALFEPFGDFFYQSELLRKIHTNLPILNKKLQKLVMAHEFCMRLV